jgi:hypothetical protein
VIRKTALALLAFPVFAHAQGLNLAGVPRSCKAPLAHDMEIANIPQILELEEGAARIASIQTLGDPGSYQYYPGLYRIDCIINVRWSNGTVDWAHKFSIWDDKYGQTMVGYGPQD